VSPALLSQIMDMQKTLQALAETNSKLMIEIGRSKKTNARQHQYSSSRDEQEPTAFLGKRKIVGNQQQQQQQFSSSDSESVGTGAPSPNFSDDIRSQLYEKSGRADRRRQFKERRYYYYNSSYNIILIIRLFIY
jgi:hypothetical protein